MNKEEIRVNWRAVIVPANGVSPVHGRLRKLGKDKLTMGSDHDLKPGHRCKLVLMLPKSKPEASSRFVEGNGMVLTSILSEEQFQITLEWERLSGNDDNLLDEQIRLHREYWGR